MTKIKAALFTLLWCIASIWIMGYDFDHRGADALILFLGTSVFTVMAYTFPGLEK